MPTILFAAPDLWPAYQAPLEQALHSAGIAQARLVCDAPPEEVDYIIYAPSAPLQDFSPFTRCRAVLSLWAGVERIVGNATLTQPLCRLVDPSLTQGMVEYVTGHVLRHHLGMDAHIRNPQRLWDNSPPPLASERRVTLLGLGELGQAVAQSLKAFGFRLTGWSRSPKAVEGIRCLHGEQGLNEALEGAEIIITLLPRTPQTENILDAAHLALPAKGAAVINPGRGALIDDDALLAALATGAIGHATLDVFRIEPLPQDHPFWNHPQVTITPHIAAATRPRTAAQVIVENIRRAENGLPLLYLVDRARGY